MMVRRNLSGLLVLSLVLSVAFAVKEKEKVDESDKKDLSEKKDEKTVSKRGIFHNFGTHGHGHTHRTVISYHLPQAAQAAPAVVVQRPPVPVVVQRPSVPVVFQRPVVSVPIAPPAPVIPPQPQYQIVPGGASVTSYSVNYPRALLPQPAVPVYPRPFVPSFGAPAVIPSLHHHYQPAVPHYHHSPAVPHYHPAPAVPHYHHSPAVPHFHPVASVPNYHSSPAVPHYHPASVVPTFVAQRPVTPVAVPEIRYPQLPVFTQQPRPVFGGFTQFVPNGPSNPTFIPVAVPSNPQPIAPQNPGMQTETLNPGFAQDTNMVITQQLPQIPMPTQPTQPTFAQQPTQTTFVQQPTFIQPQPGFSQSQPGFSQQQPGFSQSQPGFSQQQPGFLQTQPGFSQPQPGFSQTQPGFSQSQPGFSQTQPGFSQSQPGFSQQPSFIQPSFQMPLQPTRPSFQIPFQPARPSVGSRPTFVQRPSLNKPISPTKPIFGKQPTLQTMTSHGMRPIIMMTHNHHRPQPTQPTFTNKAPYNYHAPTVPFNHDQASSTNDIVSGHGHMSSQLMHQLALYQHQQHQQQQGEQYIQQQEPDNSYPYPAAAETFQGNYDPASNDGQYHGLSSYQVPVHH